MTGFSGLLMFILIICVYNVWNEFISLSNPYEFELGKDSVTFRAYKQEHTYKISEMTNFSMRMVAGNTSIYMNINKRGILKGRYWIRVSEFEEQDEIVDYFYDLDEKVNPDSVVTRARKEGRERLAQKKELEKQKKISKKLVKN
mgnify:FL=1